mmetsp:Transcript_46877/g.111634  ORF Transcript_46877/g.111634 Transcript_46877/m.111634 type:complete len:233 (+) Transcript_46877:712-1410(+)
MVHRVGLALDGARDRLGRSLWVDLHEHRQRQVRLEILENNLHRVALQQLQQLDAHEASHHGGGGGKGRDDAPCDQPRLELLDLLDGVVARAQVRERGDEVHVEVRIVVLLEFEGSALGPSELGARGQHRQLLRHLHEDGLVVRGRGRRYVSVGVLLAGLDGDAALCGELRNDHVCQEGEERCAVPLRRVPRNAVDLGLEVGSGDDEVEVLLVGCIERQRRREPLGRRPEGRS